jgi:hypothetical protein
MREYITSEFAPYTLVEADVAAAEERLIQEVMEGELRPIYEAALLDGANEQQAKLTAMGMDFTMSDSEFPPVGWYRCRPEYAEMFCYDWEMKE